LEIVSLAGSELGKFPSRNTVVYAFLSLITLNLFTVYWWYTLSRDPNEHFKAHRLIEEEIASKIASLKA